MQKDLLLGTALIGAIALGSAVLVTRLGWNLAVAAIPVLVSIPLVSRIHLR